MARTGTKMPEYSDESFWSKVSKTFKKAGKEVIEKALILYYAAQSRKTPKWARGVIYSSLAYLIWPLDAIPDAIPAAGYTDDLGALALAMTVVAVHITPAVKRKAKQKMKDIFGSD